MVVCWYFNLRLQHDWVQSALLAAMVLITAWHVVGLIGYALGRPYNPFDGFVDGAVFPGMLLAFAVLYFYPASLAERRVLAEGVVRSSLAGGLIIRWLWRRRQAGPLLMRLAFQSCSGHHFCVSCGPFHDEVVRRCDSSS